MKLLPLLVLVMACGGKAVPPPAPEPMVEPPRATRVPIEDDEPEEGVEFVNTRGRMDPAAIEAGIAPHTQALGACYTTNLNRRRWLGGHVVIHWEINKDGVVTEVRLAESDLGAWPIERCLLEVARAATFEKPIGGDADFQLPLDFSAKGSSVRWEEDKALRAVGGQVASLDACARGGDDAGKGKSKGKGKGRGKTGRKGKDHGDDAGEPTVITAPSDVTLTLYVGPGGRAQSVGFSGGSRLEDAWAECAEQTALAWRLPDPRGHIAKLVVRYPMR